jgi:hypothetical protein
MVAEYQPVASILFYESNSGPCPASVPLHGFQTIEVCKEADHEMTDTTTVRRPVGHRGSGCACRTHHSGQLVPCAAWFDNTVYYR